MGLHIHVRVAISRDPTEERLRDSFFLRLYIYIGGD